MRWILVSFLLALPLSPQAAQESWTRAIESLIAAGDLPQARLRLDEEKAARGETPAFLYLDARILFNERRYNDALGVAQRALATASTDPELYKLAALSAIRLDRLDIAEPALKTAVRLAPHDYLAHFHLGALYYTKSLFAPAKPELEKAAELNPNYMPALLFLGLTLEELGDEKATIAAYRRAMDTASAQRARKEMPYVYLGRFYYRLGRFEEGLPLLEKAVEINPSSGEGLLELGKALHALNRDSDAAAILERASAADGVNPEPHYLLFRILQSQGREQAAQEELRRFQDRNKETVAGDAARRKLRNMQ
jgi:tetratricopeptide (TPR) repeat protein